MTRSISPGTTMTMLANQSHATSAPVSPVLQEAAGPRVAIVLPAYNEEVTIEATIAAFHDVHPAAAIYVINNNSNDATAAVALATLARLGCRGAVLNERQQGKGNAVRRAFADIEADFYVLADADLTYPAHRIHDLLAPVIAGDADMVVGDRHSGGHYDVENKRPFHGIGNRLVQGLVNRLFGTRLVDIMSGYRAFSRTFVKGYPILVEGFQIETDVTLHAFHRRFRVLEIPVEYRDRPPGSFSKLSTFTDGATVIFTIAQILRYYRPLLFFGGAAVLLAVLGVVAGAPVLNDWFSHQYIYHVPLAILATGLETVAMMLLGIGLILDAISHKDKADYEQLLVAIRGDSQRALRERDHA